MSILHLCNTFFEAELAGLAGESLEEAMEQNPVFKQLQFLPLFYAKEGDGLLVSKKPSELVDFPLYTFEERPPFTHLETWGYSRLAQVWAEQKEISYAMPPWDVVKMVNSKSYSFSKSPLPGATLIFQGDPIKPKSVLKSCFGVAGRELVLSESSHALTFCEQQWKMGLPVICEPFVARELDFSTQWIISRGGEIAYLGVTVCKSSKAGKHQGNVAGMLEPKELEAQKEMALEILEEMALMGYFGHVGFDAMVYEGGKLQPVVEINARKTMGWVALEIQQKKYPEKQVELAYQFQKDALLPKIQLILHG